MSNDAANTKPLRRSSGWFVFLVLSGILPFLARYGVFSQWILLLHILAGLLAVVPVTIVRWKHVHAANQETPARWWSSGLWTVWGWLALAGSGLWLVGRGLWGVFVPYRMHYFHLAVGVAFGALGILHIVIGLLKSPYPLELYAQPARPLVLWTVVFAIGAVVLGIARRPGIRATGDFAPSNAFS